MKKVAFICVHNSCRSQMAEAFGKILGLNVFESYSAGTEERDKINEDAVRIMKEIGVDMELTQRPKLLIEIPEVDIVITMGCNVSCPTLPCKHREDWGLEDPSGKSVKEFIYTRDKIKEKVEDLVNRIKNGQI
ncbi:arsenate reductase ArsC [Clostridium perfringens]|uniref:arsenate reductase ArsC n=1 Tax=Clostridium perfringens TaxID=1502 RepID=UPI0022485257|nr:arsenate reductase ArsC [Clostridium perfringens]MCX0394436.1 arsenate reductase ArsC [Clostridium perfringens]